MDFINLKYFQIAAKARTFTEAAKSLNISQPGLSKAIKQLESEIGVILFNRNGREVYLNNYGKTLLSFVDKAFVELDSGIHLIQEDAGLENGNINFSATFPHVFPLIMTDFLDEYPNVHITQKQSSSKEMENLILQNEIDFGISTSPLKSNDIQWVPLAIDEIYLTVPKTHRLANRNSISLTELESENFIGLLPSYGFREITDAFCEATNIQPQYKLELEESTSILKFVSLGYGISFTPKISLIHDQSDVLAIPIDFPKCERNIGIVYKEHHFLSTAAKKFIDYTIDWFTNYSDFDFKK
ncbi:LysR family transcriptional regulator [Staphylococcus sp. 2S1]